MFHSKYFIEQISMFLSFNVLVLEFIQPLFLFQYYKLHLWNVLYVIVVS